jgi:L-methionine (R)-S-oxide reductase
MTFVSKVKSDLSKEEKYLKLIPRIRTLIENEKNLIANLANITAVIKQTFDEFLWVGFYLTESDSDDLVLGPFQGKVSCTRIPPGKGVCGFSAIECETVIVDDVHEFPGHIACDPSSNSEIVIPLIYENDLKGVLDIDSEEKSAFDKTDKIYLEMIVNNFIHIFR